MYHGLETGKEIKTYHSVQIYTNSLLGVFVEEKQNPREKLTCFCSSDQECCSQYRVVKFTSKVLEVTWCDFVDQQIDHVIYSTSGINLAMTAEIKCGNWLSSAIGRSIGKKDLFDCLK